MQRLVRSLSLALPLIILALAPANSRAQCLVCPCVLTNGQNGWLNCIDRYHPDGTFSCLLGGTCYGWTGPGGGGGGCATQPDPLSTDNVMPCATGREIRPAFAGVVATALFAAEVGSGRSILQEPVVLERSMSAGISDAEEAIRGTAELRGRIPLGPAFVSIRAGGAAGYVRTERGDGFGVRAQPNDGFVDLVIDRLTRRDGDVALAQLRLGVDELGLVPVTIDEKEYTLAIWTYSAPNDESGWNELLSHQAQLREQFSTFGGPRSPMLLETNPPNPVLRSSWGAMKATYR